MDINGLRAGDVPRGRKTRRGRCCSTFTAACPTTFCTQRYPTGLEAEDFVVCWWEQRGAGLSYRPGMSPESVTVWQLVSDTLALTNYLAPALWKGPNLLDGAFRRGAFLACTPWPGRPSFYHAYSASPRWGNQLRSEERAYDYMLGRRRAERRAALARKLEAAPGDARRRRASGLLAGPGRGDAPRSAWGRCGGAVGRHGPPLRVPAKSGLHADGEDQHVARQKPRRESAACGREMLAD